jgi:GDPmannose 4,6-dehydratase
VRALISGSCGQDGFYLTQYLRSKGHTVQGFDRRGISGTKGDITDPVSVGKIVRDFEPDWVFNLAGQSFVGDSWDAPRLHAETNYGGVLNVLEALRRYAPNAHMVQASTSEMFGSGHSRALSEEDEFMPSSPYAVAKLAAHHLCRVYRESYGMHVSCSISFNHESPRRPPQFVTRKITQTAAKIASGQQEMLHLGNIDSCRDWGFAGDYVKAFVLMAEQQDPADYVIGTGVVHSIRDVLDAAFSTLNLDWKSYVVEDEFYLRPFDVNWLCSKPARVKLYLGWQAETSFEELILMMVKADVQRLSDVSEQEFARQELDAHCLPV